MDTPCDIEVTDRQSFINFLELLRNDYLSNQSDWENLTIDRFLEARSVYTNHIQGCYDNTHQNINADKPSWKVFADMLKSAKIYE
jgi:GTPase SAR1 family protein